MKMYLKRLVLMAAVVVLFAALAVLFSKGSDPKLVTILFTNDVNTHIDNPSGEGLRYSHVAWLKKRAAEEGGAVFLVDAGDYLQGTAYGVFDGGRRIVELMNAAGYDVATVGNHEFDYHVTNLLARASEARFPLVGCNFWRKDAPGAAPSEALAAYAVVTNRGVSVAFVGLTTPLAVVSEDQDKFRESSASGRQWGLGGFPRSAAEEFYAAVQTAVDEARKWRPDYVVLVGHAGMDDDLAPFRSYDVISRTTGYDCFIDGHSHTENAMQTVPDGAGRSVVVAQAGCHLAAVGRMELSQDHGPCSRLVKSADGRDEVVAEMEERLIRDLADELAAPLAELRFDMPARDEDGSWLVRSGPAGIGDLVTDAFLWYANSRGDGGGADVAIIQAGGIRDGFRAGTVTMKDVLSVSPFRDELLVAKLSGRALLDALEWGADVMSSTGDGRLLHVAGLRYVVATNLPSAAIDCGGIWSGRRTDVSGRVCDVETYDRTEGVWRPLDPDREYCVAGTAFLLRGGGDGYAMLTNSAPVPVYSCGESGDRQIAGYLKSFTGRMITSENSPLYERGYAEALAYERPQGGGRIGFVARGTGFPAGAERKNTVKEE